MDYVWIHVGKEMEKNYSQTGCRKLLHPKVSGLAAWSENCKWHSFLQQLYRYFVSQSSEFCRHNPLCCFSTSVYCFFLFRYRLSPEIFGYTLINRVYMNY
jgi:hypothetical protein